MSSSSQSGASYVSKYYFENSNALFPHNQKAATIDLIDNAEYWTFEKMNGDDILLTLSWNENTTPAPLLIDPISLLHIVRWDDTNKQWIDEGGVADSGQKTVTTAVNVSGYGTFTLARVKEDSSDDVIIHNAISPNGDNSNEYFYIEGITKYPNNKVTIYNRWGVKIFETSGYDNNTKVFRGYSEGRTTIGQNKPLPDGTYFYTVEYEISNQTTGSRSIKKAGYLYLSSN
jgi:gliding motility-associated-like protein